MKTPFMPSPGSHSLSVSRNEMEWKILKQDILLKQQDMESKQLLVEGVIAAATATAG
jgi:hypothetical protein